MIKQSIRSARLVILVFSLITALSACTSEYPFQVSSVVPAARGGVTVEKDANNNYQIKINISDLAEVKRLQPPREAYVVWMVGDQAITKNMGQIKSSSSMMSSKLKASFQGVSSGKPHRIFITAEDNAMTNVPGPMVILSTNKF